MKPEEAIEIAIYCLCVSAGYEACEECKIYGDDDLACREVARYAIEALKEVQQYREIGTVRELREMASIVRKAEKDELAKIIDEWIDYHKIGTVEECREAVEKQKAKAVKNRKLLKDFHGSPYCIQGDCPNCECKSIKATATDYCYVCGQKLKWDENFFGGEGNRRCVD